MPVPPSELSPLISEERIREIVGRLASEVTADHPADETLVMVAAMKGAICFCADLMRQLDLPLELELLQPTSYHGRARGDLTLEGRLDVRLVAGEHVLLVDCVLDSGSTLGALHRHVAARGPASVKTCVLVSKQVQRAADVDPDYVGVEIGDEFIVGYGLDYADHWRHLPYIAVLQPERDG
jgi:hypoxanthine phosphoribosyltransferase